MVVTLAVLGTLAAQAWLSYRGIQGTQQTDLRLTELGGDIRYFDEVLTMAARMAAATGDLKWEARYRAGETRLDAAIREALALAPDELSPAVAETNEANVQLVELENRAFALVRNGHNVEASAVLSSDAYEERKARYSSGLNVLTGGMQARIHNTLRTQRDRAKIGVLSAAGALVLVFFTWLRVSGEVREHVAATRRAEQAEREAARLEAVQSTITTLHHEINNPLQIIMGKTELALADAGDGQRDLLRAILASAEEVAELVRKLEVAERVDTQPYVGGHLMLDTHAHGSPETPVG